METTFNVFVIIFLKSKSESETPDMKTKSNVIEYENKANTATYIIGI